MMQITYLHGELECADNCYNFQLGLSNLMLAILNLNSWISQFCPHIIAWSSPGYSPWDPDASLHERAAVISQWRYIRGTRRSPEMPRVPPWAQLQHPPLSRSPHGQSGGTFRAEQNDCSLAVHRFRSKFVSLWGGLRGAPPPRVL